jgi:hypothetical protein
MEKLQKIKAKQTLSPRSQPGLQIMQRGAFNNAEKSFVPGHSASVISGKWPPDKKRVGRSPLLIC